MWLELAEALNDLITVRVHWALEQDNSHTIAAYALHLGGAVLSRDSEFFRYYKNISGQKIFIEHQYTAYRLNNPQDGRS
jgi:hypothetical protein